MSTITDPMMSAPADAACATRGIIASRSDSRGSVGKHAWKLCSDKLVSLVVVVVAMHCRGELELELRALVAWTQPPRILRSNGEATCKETCLSSRIY